MPYVTYDARFLVWWGILLFCTKLGSRRQLDFGLRDMETAVLGNINRLAHTAQESLPVHDTLDYFLSKMPPDALGGLLRQCVQRLIRMKALDDARLLGHLVVVMDGTGYVRFHYPHCDQCLTQRHDGTTVYLHPVVEAKLVSAGGLAISVGSEFIENPSQQLPAHPAQRQSYDTHKQDCELTAFRRLAATLKAQYPQTPLCISADSLYGCGTGMDECIRNGWLFMLVFKQGRTPALWDEFQSLLALQPANRHTVHLPDGRTQTYRWVNDLPYTDEQNRSYMLHAIICKELCGQDTTTYAWLTNAAVTATNVVELANKGGRIRSTIENQGFNMQKNGGYNLEHAYSFTTVSFKAFYTLLQLAHLLLQLVEHGSLLQVLACKYEASSPRKLFGSIRNYAQRLLECLRYYHIPHEAFDPLLAAACHIRLDTG